MNPGSLFRIPASRRPWVLCGLGLVGYFAGLRLAAAAWDLPVALVWRKFGVFSYDRPFYDLANIAHAIATNATGGSPYGPAVTAGSFPPYNYPRVWMAWRALGLSAGTVPIWGVAVAGWFWAWSLAFLRPRRMSEAAVTLAWWCSPAFMLGVERANSDLVVFGVLAFALLIQQRSTVASMIAVFVAAAAKLYPMAAVAALLARRDWRAVRAAGLVAAAFGVYAWVYRADLGLIASRTPRDTSFSYGCAIPFQLAGLAYPAAYGIGVVVAASVALLAWRWRRFLPPVPERARIGCVAGAAVYGGTFLLGNSYEYRLIFLQLCLPAFWHWRDHGDPAARRFATIFIGLSVIAAWCSVARPYFGAGAEMARQLATWPLLAIVAVAGFNAFRQPGVAPIAPTALPVGER